MTRILIYSILYIWRK